MSNNPHSDWMEEKERTKLIPNWKADLLTRVAAILGPWGKWADKVGFKLNETQIQFRNPVNSLFSYPPLEILWAQINVWDPQTKKPGTRVVRFGPDVASLMVLVKSGSRIYLLARRKYQFASKEISTELSRGWIKDEMISDQGWKLFKRDFPGLEGNPVVNSITEKPMGSSVWENNAEHANKISHHLIVVTLNKEMSKEDLQKLLVEAKLHQERPDESLDGLGVDDLVSQPVVFEIEEAAELLNAHLSGKTVPLALFGENYSTDCWSRFLVLHGKQFSQLLPEQQLI